jgi:YidC/Oxa1 family membrane protein insertase
MALWDGWIDLISALFGLLTMEVGLSAGLAVIALTLLLRTLVLPITWSTAYRGQVRREKLATLQPELERVKARHAKDPQKYAEAVLEIHRRHGISLVDGRSLLGALVQMPVLLGAFVALRQGLASGRFLWVADLAKPDVLLAIVAGLTTAFLALAAPELPAQMRMIMTIVPVVCLALTALHFASAIALYWATSNVFTAAQAFAVRAVLARRPAGAAQP